MYSRNEDNTHFPGYDTICTHRYAKRNAKRTFFSGEQRYPGICACIWPGDLTIR